MRDPSWENHGSALSAWVAHNRPVGQHWADDGTARSTLKPWTTHGRSMCNPAGLTAPPW